MGSAVPLHVAELLGTDLVLEVLSTFGVCAFPPHRSATVRPPRPNNPQRERERERERESERERGRERERV
jgi:hypothetical protein